MGKYDKFKGMIPTYKAAVFDLKKEFSGLSETELLEKFSELKDHKRALEASLKEVEKELTAVTEVLVEEMEGRELTQLKHSRLGLFSTRTKVYVQQKDLTALKKWLRENEYGDIIKEQVNHNVLNSLMIDILSHGSLPNDAGINVFLKSGITNTPIKQ